MKKALKIIAIVSGLITLAATVILAYLYVEDASKYLRNARRKIVGRISNKLMGQDKIEEEICECE